jgi:hypothetical protein
MGEVADLEQLLRRLLAGSASEADRGALEEAFASGRLTLATGARAGDIIIVTGDGNILFQGGDAAAVREAFLALTPPVCANCPPTCRTLPAGRRQWKKLLQLVRDGSGQAAISVLEGMGGTGKTALAVHVAHKLAVHYPEAQIVVDLAGTSEAPEKIGLKRGLFGRFS